MQEKKEEDHLQVLNKVSEVGIDEVGRGAVSVSYTHLTLPTTPYV